MNGRQLVSIARNAISDLNFKACLGIKKGVFVTIYSYPERNLRGCIGFIEPVELGKGICDAARGAAFHDPRFKALGDEEFVIDVSVLDEPSLLDDINDLEIGRDGLIVERGFNKGLLLPQVAVEHNFNKEEFLEQCCLKAGLDRVYDDCNVYFFKALVFSETIPNGRVIKKFK